jgi:D-alanine transaminase
MLNEEAMQHDCYETVLIRDGVVTEASHCNVFFVKNSTVYTHRANEFILDGITRQVVLELCENLNIEVKQEPIAANHITQMEEAFLAGTSTQIASIQKIDNHEYYVGDKVGPITQLLQNAFLDLKSKKS